MTNHMIKNKLCIKLVFLYTITIVCVCVCVCLCVCLNSHELIGLETKYLEGTFPMSNGYIFMYNAVGAWS